MAKIIIHEVGPRDGLQVEKTTVPLAEKIRWIDGLCASGIDIIQLGSFVNPAKVPQMADTDALFRHFTGNKPAGVTLLRAGPEREGAGARHGLRGGDVLHGSFSQRDPQPEEHRHDHRRSPPAHRSRWRKQAMAAGKKVQASVQSAFGCGFEGPIDREKVLSIVKAYLDAGIRNISLADTAGHAQPQQVEDLYGAIRALDPSVELACHFHNTYGLGLANCYAALKSGVTYFESAFGGLGGCPFTKLPAGNVSTEDLVHSLQRMGLRTDIKLDVLLEVARQVGKLLRP